MLIIVEDPTGADVIDLLTEHLADMHRVSPPESIHALDPKALAIPAITFWTARDDAGRLMGCGALKELGPGAGEVKSMRTADAARKRGVGSAVLAAILAEALHRGYHTVSLETGSQPFFEPARRLYRQHGFTECGPFADYVLDPNSMFMSLRLP
jgi:putative acetyltransferase